MTIQTISIFYNIIFLTLLCPKSTLASDIISSTQSISGNKTLVSAQGKFCLGFFTPGNSNNNYLGIWFNNIPNQTIVWVANRDYPLPLNQSTGTLRFGNDGNLILIDQADRIVWSTNTTNLPVNNTVFQLLDTGNLVLRDKRVQGNASFWQSFDYPSHALLAGMKIGWDSKSSLNRYLRAWENEDNPASGSYTYRMDKSKLPQLVLRRGTDKVFRSGLWNGVQFGTVRPLPIFVYLARGFTDLSEAYFEYDISNKSMVTMLRLSSTGLVQRLIWDFSTRQWHVTTKVPRPDGCDNYNHCGPNAVCNVGDRWSCSCLTGYKPRNPQEWDVLIRTGGCIRDALVCDMGDGFIEVVDIKLPDLLEFWKNNNSMTLDECRRECLKNCSCTAYANPDVTGRNGSCLLWFNDLIDLRKLIVNNSQILYLRASASYLSSAGSAGSSSKNQQMVVVAISVSIGVLLLVASCIIWKRRLILGICSKGTPTIESINEQDEENMELSIFSRAALEDATNNFSPSNKVGEGGFGPVYKGMLPNGQEIAVKRLSKTSSGQGVNEFKTEVTLIAKLQHRNLVRLLGCCIQGDEKMLVYEYLPNGSLDSFIFSGTDKSRNNFLMWRRRFDIIIGIARGLLYLHQDSRLRIIHRDLKASNVLLDADMNPKISDFGTARAFGGDQLKAQTVRVIGTYGYMSPEYAIDGIFSVKSDVFSFGVLVLEIVSGERNRQFNHPDHNLNLLGHAWRLWTEGKAYELMDPLLIDSLSIPEVVKCIQVGLLCVQQKAEDRPEMSQVLLMLNSASVKSPQPNQPGFFAERSSVSTTFGITLTTDDVTNTLLEGR